MCRSFAVLVVGTACCATLMLAGCSRSKARLRADHDAYCLTDQKAAIVTGEIGNYRIGVAADSRMFDPNNPDCPPMPPDDPLSHAYLECVDGKKGAKCWREAARTPFVVPSEWRHLLPLNEKSQLVLDTHAAVRLGLKNDPNYQRELEELYLSALDVSFERFRFDTQLFGGAAIDFTADGRDRSGTGESSSLLRVSPSDPSNRWRLQRLTATGGNIVVGLANTLVWQFAGPNDYFGTSLLDFSIVQPLLRGGGRVRIMERLTVAERTLLANVRSMERFRREYYLSVVVGRATSGGPQRRGGFLGGAGLANFSGVNRGVGFGGVGGGFVGAAEAGGYLGLLQTRQVLRNLRANVAALQDSSEQLIASSEAGRIDRFQVELARQALFNAQSQLLSAEANYQSSLDNYKINLGLPPDLDLVVDDSLLDQFNLLDDRLTELQNRTAESLQQSRNAALAAKEEAKGTGPELLPFIKPESLPSHGATEAEELLRLAGERLEIVESDMEKLLKVAPARRKHLQELASRPEIMESALDASMFDPGRFDARLKELKTDLTAMQKRFAKLEKQSSKADHKVLTELSGQLLELSILQARVRLDTIDLDPLNLGADEALQIAEAHRRDWANARAGLVDAWRLVHFNANDLESAVDLTFSGDIGNVGESPFDLRSSNGRLRVGVEFDSPTSRLAERNVYRQSLIEYQQARRGYYRFVDRISQGLRATIRQVQLNEINLELRREAVLIAIAQVDLTRLRLSEPPKPGATEQFNNTTARDLVQALGDLLTVQNDLLSVWVNNHVQRMNLELDLGLMLVDSEGLRVAIDQPLKLFLSDDPCSSGGGDIRLLPPVGPLCFPLQESEPVLTF